MTLNATVYGLYALNALFGLAALLFFIWAVRSGAVRDDEAPKYRMLEDDVLGGHPGAASEGHPDSQPEERHG